MIDPLLLLRKAKVKTSIGEIEVEEFTFIRELLFFSRVSKEDITTQVSFICPKEKSLLLLTQKDKESIIKAKNLVNSPLPIPPLPSGGKKVDSNFFDCLLLLCDAKVGSLSEIINTYSVQQINEIAYCIQDKYLRFNSSSPSQSIEEKMQNAIEGTGVKKN